MNNLPVTSESFFFTNQECDEWVNYITSHKFYSFDNKKKLGGFTLKYSELHENEFHNKDLNLLKIFELYKRIKQPGTNAYVFNPLVIESCTKEMYDGLAVDYHFDRTAMFYTPTCVTVIYIEVPENFKCGRLCLHVCNTIEKKKPELGKKIVFDGNILHGVEQIVTENPSRRISLVFEQYKLDTHDLDNYEFDIYNDIFDIYKT